MKRYELKFNKEGRAVFKVSVVKDAAINTTLVHFSSEKDTLQCFTDQEKRVIYSVVMRPNVDIFRKNVKGEPAEVFYTPETVEFAQVNYFRNNGNSATNINHSEHADAEGIFPFESWIVSDAKTDRAVNFGLEVIAGDWVMGMKVDNDELWEEHLKTGKLDGFSVEATNINYELKEDIKMNKDDKKKKGILTILKEAFANAEENFEGEIETEEERKAREAAEAAEAAEAEVGDAEEATATEATEATEAEEEPTEKEAALIAEVSDLKAQIATLKADKVKAEADLETMANETPAASGISNLPTPPVEDKAYKDMNNREKMIFNREKKQY